MDKIAIIDFGGQYTHLIANRIRYLGVYSEILSTKTSVKELSSFKGIIFSGGPHSVYGENSPQFNDEILESPQPIMGICYGHQLLCKKLGGKVKEVNSKEYGKAQLKILNNRSILKGIEKDSIVWMSHRDAVTKLPKNFFSLARTQDCEYAVVQSENEKFFGLQFHPEVTHSKHGDILLKNFLSICQCQFTWKVKDQVKILIKKLKKEAKNKKVFMLVSGGVDSTVAFTLLNKALGQENVFGVHINNGLMRKSESKWVLNQLQKIGFNNLKSIDAKKNFLSALGKACSPQEKRIIIGNTFLDIIDKEVPKYINTSNDDFVIAQGTIYPDTIESGSTEHSSLIKTHHNRVAKIIELIKQKKIVEPLKNLYKNEVRSLGEILGLDKEFIHRHPFPGPGLGVRVLCSKKSIIQKKSKKELKIKNSINNKKIKNLRILPIKSVGIKGDERNYAYPCAMSGDNLSWQELEEISSLTNNKNDELNRVLYQIGKDKLDGTLFLNQAYLDKKRISLLRKIDNLVTKFLKKENLYHSVWQFPVVLIPVASIKNKESIVLRPIDSQEAMTANFSFLPWDFVYKLSHLIIEKFSLIDLVFYDITHKPPGTIEWE